MNSRITRRAFVKQSALAAAALAAGHASAPAQAPQPAVLARLPFQISLAEWSLHRALFSGKLAHLDFPAAAAEQYDIHAIELVNQFFMDKAGDTAYLAELHKRAGDLGVRILLIMCDGEGALGDADPEARKRAVTNHHKWADAAKSLGCHSIRVNAQSSGSFDEQQDRAADGLRQLCDYAAPLGLNVIVENHGGLSSNGAWLAGVIRKVGLSNCGTLPDFGNFYEYDRYQGVAEMMPYAKGVSAKSHDFDAAGSETTIDYSRMLKIVVDAGYHGHLGVEYEGDRLSEPDGIRATKALLEKVRSEMMAAHPPGPRKAQN
jgi:L-ribulose-5-phosphate 3-epimerase